MTLRVITVNGSISYCGLSQAQVNHIITMHSEILEDLVGVVDWVRFEVQP